MLKKTLTKHAEALKLDAEQVEKIADLMARRWSLSAFELPPQTAAWVRQCYHIPRKDEMFLHAIAEIGGWQDPDPLPAAMRTDDVRFEVFNAGDTYTSTLVWDREKDRFFVSTFGDMVEQCERLGLIE